MAAWARLRAGVDAVLGDESKGLYFVAEAEGRVVGQLMITFEWSDWRNAQFWWIQSVYVHPDWRRKGIYRSMHGAIINLARSQPGVCGVRLYVEGDNHIAKCVYERVGLSPSSYQEYESEFVLPTPHSARTKA